MAQFWSEDFDCLVFFLKANSKKLWSHWKMEQSKEFSTTRCAPAYACFAPLYWHLESSDPIIPIFRYFWWFIVNSNTLKLTVALRPRITMSSLSNFFSNFTFCVSFRDYFNVSFKFLNFPNNFHSGFVAVVKSNSIMSNRKVLQINDFRTIDISVCHDNGLSTCYL